MLPDTPPPEKSAAAQDLGAIVRTAEWAVTNKFLTALTRFATPVCIVAVGWVYNSVTSLVAETQTHSGKIMAVEHRLDDARSNIDVLNAALSAARERIVQLQTLETTQSTLYSRLTEFRQDLRDIRARLDQMAPPPPVPYYRNNNPN